MNKNARRFIGVIGGYPCSAEEAATAEAVGRELARQGAILICGGEGGVMEAACKGAQAEGGITIGILPGDNRHSANAHVMIPIVTGFGPARNIIIVKSSQAVIAIGGGYGTLSEISFALKFGVPVVGLSTWNFSRCNQADSSVIRAEDALTAVRLAIQLAASPPDKVNKANLSRA
jgi:uncharacterized protein (TIGR00725 family)